MNRNAKVVLQENQPNLNGTVVKRDSATGLFMSTKLMEIAADPKRAAAFLKKAGIITPSGNLTGHYK